jgi:hypothetical protein
MVMILFIVRFLFMKTRGETIIGYDEEYAGFDDGYRGESESMIPFMRSSFCKIGVKL